MRVSEVFATLQGEGLLSGVPSLFVRVSGCNLRCTWCDTPYTSWQPEGETWSLERLLAWTEQHPGYRHLVLTGGEPLLFPESVEWTRALRARGLHVTIETAGAAYQPVECDLMSVSPKLANSTPWDRDPVWAARHEAARLNWEILRTLAQTYECQWKFVVAAPADLEEIQSIADRLKLDPTRVLLMPEGTQPATLNERSQWLAEECKRTGYRFCPRLHILLWGNRRGV